MAESGNSSAAHVACVQIAESLRSAGFEVSDVFVGGHSATVARRSEFRLRWMASRLDTSVFLVAIGASDFDPDAFVDSTVSHTVDTRTGRALGLQKGVAAISVVIGDGLPDAVSAWATRARGRRFGALAWPVAADLRARSVVQPGLTWIGIIFVPYFRRLIRDHVRPVIESTPLTTTDS